MSADFWTRLAAPFPPSEIDWRVGNITKNRDRGTVLAYLNARAVQDRLDEVCTPAGWFDEYETGPDGGVLCRLHIKTPEGEWLSKCDGAPNTQIESVKGGLSGALKRAAVKWGIGRGLYYLDAEWVKIDPSRPRGEHVYVPGKGGSKAGYMRVPTLPDWCLPGGSGRPHKAPPSTMPSPPVSKPQSAPKPPVGTDWTLLAREESRRAGATPDTIDALCKALVAQPWSVVSRDAEGFVRALRGWAEVVEKRDSLPPGEGFVDLAEYILSGDAS